MGNIEKVLTINSRCINYVTYVRTVISLSLQIARERCLDINIKLMEIQFQHGRNGRHEHE